MGSFLHGVALLGYDVSPVCLLLVYSDGMILGGLITNYCNGMIQEEVFCGSEGREERSDVYRDGVGRNQTAEMCELRKLFGRETLVPP